MRLPLKSWLTTKMSNIDIGKLFDLDQFTGTESQESINDLLDLSFESLVERKESYYKSFLSHYQSPDIPVFHYQDLKDLRDIILSHESINKDLAKEILTYTKDIRLSNEGFFTEYLSKLGYQETLSDLDNIITSLEEEATDTIYQAFKTMINDIESKGLREIQQEQDLYNKIIPNLKSIPDEVENKINLSLQGLHYLDVTIIKQIEDSLKENKEISVKVKSDETKDLDTILRSDIYEDAKTIAKAIVGIGEGILNQDTINPNTIQVMQVLMNIYSDLYDVIEKRHRLHLYLSNFENKTLRI